MPNTTNLEQLLSEINKIDDNKVKNLYMPAGIYAQESEDLHFWAMQDKDELIAVGLDPDLVDYLLEKAGAFREAQSKWASTQNLKEDAVVEWKTLAPGFFEMRDDVASDLAYAFRKNEDLLKRVNTIKEGTGNADLVQDLNDLSVLGKDNPEPLKLINFDFTKLDLAAQTSDEAAGILGRANGELLSSNEVKIVRDKAYTYLKETVDEIRDCGKYVFRKNPERLQGYRSNYMRKQNLKRNN